MDSRRCRCTTGGLSAMLQTRDADINTFSLTDIPKAFIVRLPFVPANVFREVFMSSLRIVTVSLIVSAIALQAVAQTPDTGPISFPAVTNTNLIDCYGYP